MHIHLQHELNRRLDLAKTTDQKVNSLEFILRLALKRIENLEKLSHYHHTETP